MNIKEIPAPTLITAGAAIAWLGSFVLRAVNPDFTGGPAADALMATVVAYYMKTRKAANGGQDDLITEVVGKFALPMISGAHADPTTPATTAQSPPKTVPPPATTPTPPKPSTPPTPGGLPWSS